MSDAELTLSPDDEFCHPIEEAENFNESMYANVLDGPGRLGVWIRVGNRPNEGHSEVTCCVYLPDGRVAFVFARPECDSNESLEAGGGAFEVVEPFEKVRMTYTGPLCVLDDPTEMSDPAKAFADNPMVDGQVEVLMQGLVAPFGGEPADGSSSHVLGSFARGHYEQHVHGIGTVTVGDATFDLDGLGLRDHSWGPRYWQNVTWYRFMPLAFTRDFAMCAVLIGDADGGLHPSGMVMRRGDDGTVRYLPTTEAEFETTYDEHDHPVAQTMTLRTAEREYVVHGESMSLIPLRNRRGGQVTRITEAMSRFTCDDIEGYGMSEYLDQIVDGVPVGQPR